ncbi:MAG: hypothetical protein ACLGIM_04605, partial [Alphaproteobacteria bacterium]
SSRHARRALPRPLAVEVPDWPCLALPGQGPGAPAGREARDPSVCGVDPVTFAKNLVEGIVKAPLRARDPAGLSPTCEHA